MTTCGTPASLAATVPAMTEKPSSVTDQDPSDPISPRPACGSDPGDQRQEKAITAITTRPNRQRPPQPGHLSAYR